MIVRSSSKAFRKTLKIAHKSYKLHLWYQAFKIILHVNSVQSVVNVIFFSFFSSFFSYLLKSIIQE